MTSTNVEDTSMEGLQCTVVRWIECPLCRLRVQVTIFPDLSGTIEWHMRPHLGGVECRVNRNETWRPDVLGWYDPEVHQDPAWWARDIRTVHLLRPSPGGR